MSDGLRLVLALLLSTCGMAWLALAMRGYWQQVRQGAGPSTRIVVTLRCLAALALALSLVLCLATDHVSMASLVWVMSLAASALIVAFTLTWRPQSLGWLLFWLRAQ